MFLWEKMVFLLLFTANSILVHNETVRTGFCRMRTVFNIIFQILYDPAPAFLLPQSFFSLLLFLHPGF